jgi:hypothetical protein
MHFRTITVAFWIGAHPQGNVAVAGLASVACLRPAAITFAFETDLGQAAITVIFGRAILIFTAPTRSGAARNECRLAGWKEHREGGWL